MLNLKMITVLLMTGLLAACGGSSSDGSLFDDNNSGNTDAGQADGDVSTSIVVEKPRLGTGVGGDFKSGVLDLSLSQISAGGSVRVKANIVDIDNKNAKVISQRYSIEFSSNCASGASPKAEFSEGKIETSSGDVSVTYVAKGCVGEDTISASLFNSEEELLHVATGKVNVAAAEVGSINFVETAASALAIQKMSNPVLPTNTTVTFKVVDKFGDPIADKEVSFSLQNDSGGVELARDNNVTNSEGEVRATVNSGTAHGAFVVNATTLATDNKTEISTSSQPISVTTGVARQDRISLSASTYNPASYNVDGVEVEITVRASDVFGNYVPTGTIINFTTESGGMPGTCAITEEGGCTVTWRSSGTRPGHYDSGLGLVNDEKGMTTIMAYTLGEAGFTDSNANNVFDIGEPFISYAEPFRDDNWDQNYDVNAEMFVDTNFDKEYSSAPISYQGTLCSEDAKASGHCASLMHVRDQIRIVQTYDSNPVIRIFECSGSSCTPNDNYALATPAAKGDFYVVLQDQNGNMAPAGTTLTVTGDGYDIFGDAGVVNNNIGELDGTGYARGFSGLPKFGMLYHVSYEPDTSPKNITVKADNKGMTANKRIQ